MGGDSEGSIILVLLILVDGVGEFKFFTYSTCNSVKCTKKIISRGFTKFKPSVLEVANLLNFP